MQGATPIRSAEGRIEAIDFLRGFTILEMTFAHFAGYFPLTLAKLISYTETAMALFVLLAGFMIGWRYLGEFGNNAPRTIRRLWRRALQIVAIQYIIIATVNAPLHLMGLYADRGESLRRFLFESATFSNQIGIVHILPTFIPLFVASPLILYLLKSGREWLLVSASAALFIVGNFRPHLLDYGEPAIFPILAIQIYFVVGCLWGKAALNSGALGPRRTNGWLIASVAALITTLYLWRKVIPGHLYSFHPLNIFGLLYHAPIITSIVLAVIIFWRKIRGSLFYWWIALLGRHALLAFVLHLYFAKALIALNFHGTMPSSLNYIFIAASVALSILILRRYELENSRQPAFWARALNKLFR